MGLDVFELFFWFIGKISWRVLRKVFKSSSDLSDGSYELIGFAISLMVIFLLFLNWVS